MQGGTIDRNPDPGQDQNAPKETLSAEALTREAAERLDEIHQYLSDRYARREVVAQSETPGGLYLDWVPIESQLGGEKPAEPPDDDRPVRTDQGDHRAELTRFELERDDAELGPPGSIPLLRVPIDRINPTVGLNDWLAKSGHARRPAPVDTPHEIAPPAAADQHKYAYTSQSLTCYGTEGNINAWPVFVEWSDEFSLGQLWLVRGSGTGLQTLEVGQQTYKDLYGDWQPHLFTYYTTNGYTQQGDNKGGYNESVAGWVQYATTIHPGALLTPLSVFGGAQYQVALKVQLWQGNWWLRVNGTWIGYYPASLYSTSGLRSQAGRLDWGGEVVDSGAHAGTTATDMGNGHWPYEGWQHCAYMNDLRYQSDTAGTMTDYNGARGAPTPNCYDIETHMSSGGSWGSYFWWGGSGRNSSCP